jgi:uncharacterized membrane protein YheB (UPF0754 family)
VLAWIATHAELLKYLSIPFVAALIGWVTNWAAIRLTFWPLEFRGLRPFLGWQGIIPSKAGKMARIFVNQTMARLGTLGEILRSMDPSEISRHIASLMDGRLEGYTDQILFARAPGIWRVVPRSFKESVYAQVREETPELVDGLVQEVSERVEELIDFEDLLVTRLEGDRSLLNRLFLESGHAEFVFLVRSGLWLGFLFGLLQLGVWWLYPAWWVLPAFGALVGYATNWLAINLIFRPLEPVRIGPWRVQGLFLRRQREVAAVWCRLVTREILTLQHLIYGLVHGPRCEQMHEIIRRHMEPLVDRALAGLGPAPRLLVGEETLAELRAGVGAKAVQVSTDPFDHWPFNRERAGRAEELLRERMEGLPPAEFQDLLRPCFEEDELKLILTGAVLGLAAGFAQLVFVF